MKFILTVLSSIIWLSYMTYAQTCANYATEASCDNTGGACKWVGATSTGNCQCASEVKLDILFGVDTSGSIGYSGFQIDKQFLNGLVTQGIGNSSRIGFTMFNTDINVSRTIQFWPTKQSLTNYVNGIYWTGGWTNTPELLISALQQFANTYDPTRQQVLMMVTDGNPCLPTSRGGCPQSVCQYATQIKAAGIRVVIIGVGDGLNTLYVQCLCQTVDDFIPVSSFTSEAFASILGSLSGILCPISKEFKVTEVKPQKKGSSFDYRTSRFVEIYNTGIDFSASDITLSGLITGTGPAITIAQGQYVVFYDATDTTGGPSVDSCHLCGDTCDLTGCTAGAGNSAYTGYCYCGNSVYIACGSSGSGACSAGSLPSGVVSGCNTCTFNDAMDRSSWNIVVTDSSSNELIDQVVYDSSSWITIDDGYSYELISKGFENDIGDNWAQSCSVFGTPGSDPQATCEERCTSSGCGTGACNVLTGLCDCDPLTGYYPQCTSPTSCTKCALVPGIDDCVVLWTKNGTDRFAAFSWTDSGRASNTTYRLTYFSASGQGNTLTAWTLGELYAAIEDYYRDNTTYGGYVQTAVYVCNSGNTVCQYYYSQRTWCTISTSAPTGSPTPAPTSPPTGSPSPSPTMAPTWGCPLYWWTNDAVCDPDRCLCADKAKECCLKSGTNNPVFIDGTYDTDRRHSTEYDCLLDAQLLKPKKRADGAAAAGSTPGYLLSEDTHYFVIDIEPDNYPCTMDIFWRLEFQSTDCNYGTRRRLAQSNTYIACDSSSTDIIRAGAKVEPTSGWLKVHGENDVTNATVSFTVTRLDCAEAAAELGITTESPTTTAMMTTARRRRLAKDTDCFDNVAIYGELVIVNATSECQPDCYDGRIYPMRIPVWYNYAAAFVAPPAAEKELPAWLWWLVAALVVFLALLALLVYKYWWKNKATGAALAATQADLDNAIAEAEDGFASGLGGNAVGFNPLATGFNPNAPAGAGNPNAPPNSGGGGADFIRPQVEKPVFRMEYGQAYGGQMH